MERDAPIKRKMTFNQACKLAIEALQKESKRLAPEANIYDRFGGSPAMERISRHRQRLQTAIRVL